MMKLQSLITPIVATPTASTTQVINCLLSYPLSPFLDGGYQILAAISVCPFVSLRDDALLTAACSTIELPRSNIWQHSMERLQ